MRLKVIFTDYQIMKRNYAKDGKNTKQKIWTENEYGKGNVR